MNNFTDSIKVILIINCVLCVLLQMALLIRISIVIILKSVTNDYGVSVDVQKLRSG